MAKKKAECYCCGKKGYQENYIEEQLDDEGHSIYFCCEHCRSVTSDEEILKEKIYSLYQSIIGTKTLNKTVKGYIRNRLDNEYKDKKEILYRLMKERKDKISEIIIDKNFPNGIVRAKFILKCIEKDVFAEHRRQQKYNDIKAEEIIPSRTTIIRKIRDISKWLEE